MERDLGARHRGLGAQDAIENYNLKKTCVKREHVDLERINDGNPNGLQCLLQEKIKKKYVKKNRRREQYPRMSNSMHRASVSQFIKLKFMSCFISISLTFRTCEYLASCRWYAGGK